MALVLSLPLAGALAVPVADQGVATQGSTDRMEDFRPFVETVCAAVSYLYRVRVTVTEATPTDRLDVIFHQEGAPDGVASVGLGQTVTVYAWQGHCAVEDAFVVHGARVSTLAVYEVDISRGCPASAEVCEEHVWN
jgi:hypothetical protein